MKTAKGLSESRSPGQEFGAQTRPRSPEPLVELPEGLCCPRCLCPVNGHTAGINPAARCGSCARNVVILGGRIPDFLAGENPSVDAILGWSDGFVQNVGPWLLALASGKS